MPIEENHNPAYTAWITAETEAYTAIHGLHQITSGARKPIPLAAMQKIVSLRKKADVTFAALRRELGMEEAVLSLPTVRDRMHAKRTVVPPVDDRPFVSRAMHPSP